MNCIFLALAVILFSFSITEACFASGVGCCGPPPPPPVGCACSAGYGCGQYGCYRMRARVASSKTLKITNDEDGKRARPQTPDEKFMSCCQERLLPDSCLDKCSFQTYTRQALQNMYFRIDKCPMQAAADIHFCAAQGRDHRQCCVRNGVASTLAGPKCLTFCDQRPGNVTQLDFSYMSCYDRFDSMKSCFYHDLTQQSRRSFRSL